MTRPNLLLLCLCLLSGCAGPNGLGLRTGTESADTILLEPVANMAGVSLRLPEMYVGDMLGTSDPLEVEEIDLCLVAQAALLGALRANDLRVEATGQTRYALAGAITEYDATDLRRTGRFKMSMLLILHDNNTSREVARGAATREFELFATPPGEQGAMGEQRFIRRKMEGFTEVLAREALKTLGLP